MTVSTSPDPALSIILVTADGFETVRAVVSHLRRQTVSHLIELLLVAPSARHLALDAGVSGDFAVVRVIETGRPIPNRDQAAAASLESTRAPIVVFLEDHVYPDPGWAAALLAAHHVEWTAVGSAIDNANPDSWLRWANFLLSYCQWLDPPAAGPIADVPINNTAYKRAALRVLGDRLGSLLGHDGGLNRVLAAQGGRFYLEPAARLAHLNVSRPLASLVLRFNAGRAFAALRAQEQRWPAAKRAAYILGSPLIPLLRLRYIWPFVRRADRRHHLFPGVLPALGLLLLAHTLGEVVGYVLGLGGSAETLARFEFNRSQFVAPTDHRTRHNQSLTVKQ